MGGAIWSAVLVLGAVGAQADAARSEDEPLVDFARQVRPILAEKCWRCHGPELQKGGLRLDSRAALARGGGSGRNLLTPTLEQNELLRRILSTQPGERMPVEDEPLSSDEIALIKKWLLQGAIWELEQTRKPISELPLKDRFYLFLERPEVQVYRPVLYLLLTGMVLLMVCERARKWDVEARFAPGFAAGVCRRLGWLRNGLLLGLPLGAALLGLYLRGDYLAGEARKARLELAQANVKLNEFYSALDSSEMRRAPYRPNHPPRLGGKYYRGNDERNPKLFNGGYYRTCTFDLSLRDGGGKPLAWGDSLAGPLTIHLEITRAPFSTPELFGGAIMGAVVLSPAAPEGMPFPLDIPQAPLREQTAGEQWVVEWPLGEWRGEAFSGVLYLYKDFRREGENQNEPQLVGEAHYSVGYSLRADEAGKLAATSDLWMASNYNVANIQFPVENGLTPAEWFDFLPIPEIVGGNSSDRKLLGVEEHLPAEKQAPREEKREQTPTNPAATSP